MARASTTYLQIERLKPGHVLFKPKHIKSKDKLLLKYKRSKEWKKDPNKLKSGFAKPLLLKSARENVNQCLQSNGKLLFSWRVNIVRLNLKTMSTVQKNNTIDLIYPEEVVMCAIPNQQFFGVDCGKGLIFIIDSKLNILVRKSTKPRKWGTIIYLDGLIYEFTNQENYKSIGTYDLKTNRSKKAASINFPDWISDTICAVFEDKIAVASSTKGSVRIFDPICNSSSKVLALDQHTGVALLVANDKLYCIQCEGHVFESIPRDFTQWLCIGRNRICWAIHGLPSFSLYNGSIYFVGAPQNPSLYKFNLKSRQIEFVDHLF